MLKPKHHPTLSSKEKANWVKETLRNLTIQEAAAQLLCPEDRGYSENTWIEIIKKVPVGSVFGDKIPIKSLCPHSKIPLLVAADLEHGAGAHLEGTVDFPWAWSIAAAYDMNLVKAMGQCTAREAEIAGVNWTFSPCVDLLLNYNNPVVSNRSLGSDPKQVSSLAVAWIQSMQKAGLAACAKHFPGDGVDDRDQHFCTSVNSLSVKEWWLTFGKVWKRVIQAGVMSIMSGHISFPAYQNQEKNPSRALPATLCKKLQINLLRKDLQFKGVIVSDAVSMGGITSRLKPEDQVVANIRAGSDVYLFADPIDDYQRLLKAVSKGIISEGQIFESAKRILEMKASLSLPLRNTSVKSLSSEEKKKFHFASYQMAQKGVVLYRSNSVTPISLKKGSRVLTVTLRAPQSNPKFGSDLPFIDHELKKLGYKVTHQTNGKHSDLLKKMSRFDAIFVNFSVGPHATGGTVKLEGDSLKILWRSFWNQYPHAIFTTFGSPYHLHELPHLPNYWMVCSQSEVSQRAAVHAWLGNFKPSGKNPSKIPDSMKG